MVRSTLHLSKRGARTTHGAPAPAAVYAWCMCGRYPLNTTPQRLGLHSGRHFNMAPSQQVPAVVAVANGCHLDLFRWGLIPACAIIVGEANELMRPIHDHMPVILEQPGLTTWHDDRRAPPSRTWGTAFSGQYP